MSTANPLCTGRAPTVTPRAPGSQPGYGPVPTATIDSQEITAFRPASLDPNAGWVAFAPIAGQTALAFDFRRNRERAAGLLARAREYQELAEEALRRRYMGPTVENAFAAAELAVKAEVYLMPLEVPRQHGARLTWWESWVELGNAPPRSSEILRRLYNERPASRYGDRPVSMTLEEVTEAVALVRELLDHTQERCRSEWDRHAEAREE